MVWDLAVAGSVVAVSFVVGVANDAFGAVHVGLESVSWLDDIVGLSMLLLGASAFVATRRVAQARRERTLRDTAEARFRNIVERVPAVSYVYDGALRPGEAPAAYISPQITTMLGFEPDAWLQHPEAWAERLHPDDLAPTLAAWEQAVATYSGFSAEYRIRDAAGAWRWIRDEAAPLPGTGRGAVPYQGVMLDITERRETEERYRRLIEDLPVAVYTDAVDELSTAVYISPRYEDLTGYSPAERLADPGLWTSILYPEDRDRVLAESHRTNVTGEPFDTEYRVIRKDGEVAWLHDHATLVDGPHGEQVWQGVLTDVTDERSAADALARRDAILEAASFAAARFVAADAWLEVVDEVLERLRRAAGADRAYLYGVAQTADDIEMATIARSGWADGGEDGFSLRASGLERWGGLLEAREVVHGPIASFPLGERDLFETAGQPVGSVLLAPVHVDGGWWGTIGLDTADPDRTWHDSEVDALVTAANTLGGAIAREQATRRYRALIEQIPAVTYVEDGLTGDEVYVSPQISDMLGYSQQEWTSEDVWTRAVHPDDLAWVVAEDDRATNANEPFSAEYRMYTKDGGLRWVRDQAVPVADDRTGTITLWQGVRFDITQEREAEERLRAAEERYRLVVEQLPAIAYIDERRDDGASRTWPCVYVSPQVETILGFTPEEWMHGPETWDDMIHPDDLARAAEMDARHYEHGEPVDIELRILDRDGNYRWVRDQAVIVYDDAGEPRWSQGIWLDVTERKVAELALEEAERRYRGIVEHVPAAIYLDRADASMESVYVSPQIETITGVTPDRWLAEPDIWLQLTDPEDRADVEASYLRAAEQRLPWSAEYRMRTPDGRTIWVHDETTILFDPDGSPAYLQGVIFDVTERKLAEQALRESEQRERQAAERLRSLDEMKNTFLAAVSHELRSPLTSILGLSLTLERAPAIEEADRQDLLGRLAGNARKLDRLLKDLLDIDRLNRGIVEPQLRMTDVGALARRTVETLDVLAGRDVQVRTDAVMLAVDPPKIERIVENLLVNAVRHTSVERRIWVSVASWEAGVLIKVDDDGPGVDQALRAEIFEPFRQGPTPSAHAPGTGVGLSLVARFAELHGGRAWVDDREGGGASFRVFIPGGISDDAAAPSDDRAAAG